MTMAEEREAAFNGAWKAVIAQKPKRRAMDGGECRRWVYVLDDQGAIEVEVLLRPIRHGARGAAAHDVDNKAQSLRYRKLRTGQQSYDASSQYSSSCSGSHPTLSRSTTSPSAPSLHPSPCSRRI